MHDSEARSRGHEREVLELQKQHQKEVQELEALLQLREQEVLQGRGLHAETERDLHSGQRTLQKQLGVVLLGGAARRAHRAGLERAVRAWARHTTQGGAAARGGLSGARALCWVARQRLNHRTWKAVAEWKHRVQCDALISPRAIERRAAGVR